MKLADLSFTAAHLRHSLLPLVLLFPFLVGGCASGGDVERWNSALATSSSSSQPRVDPEDSWPELPQPTVADFEAAMSLPDDQCDLALQLLLFCKEYSDTPPDVDRWLLQIARWRAELRLKLRPGNRWDTKLNALRRYIHQDLGFDFDPSDPKGVKPDNLFIDRVLERRRGYCVTLSMVYLMLGHAIGLEVYACRLPGHFAVLVGPDKQYIETTDLGKPRERLDLQIRYVVSSDAMGEGGVFLTPISRKAVFSTLLNNLGGIALLKGEYERSRSLLAKAIEWGPKNIEARFNATSLLLRDNTTESVHQALQELKVILELEPNFYAAYCRRAGIYHKFGDRTQAMEDLSRAKRMRPDASMPWVEEGVMLAREGDTAGAIRAFEQALERDENDLDALRNLSILLEKSGRDAEASNYRERLANLLPDGGRSS